MGVGIPGQGPPGTAQCDPGQPSVLSAQAGLGSITSWLYPSVSVTRTPGKGPPGASTALQVGQGDRMGALRGEDSVRLPVPASLLLGSEHTLGRGEHGQTQFCPSQPSGKRGADSDFSGSLSDLQGQGEAHQGGQPEGDGRRSGRLQTCLSPPCLRRGKWGAESAPALPSPTGTHAARRLTDRN